MATRKQPDTDPLLDTTVIMNLDSMKGGSTRQGPAGEDPRQGLVGHTHSSGFQPTQEHAYWQAHYRTRPYIDPDHPEYERYAPAYQYGWESLLLYGTTPEGCETDFTEMERKLGYKWRLTHDPQGLAWKYAQPAARDAWEHLRESRRNAVRLHKPR